tara:strand:+ start:6718 stop:7587 length:870 start_codon:yes stop_codon:yes gene_type:complete
MKVPFIILSLCLALSDDGVAEDLIMLKNGNALEGELLSLSDEYATLRIRGEVGSSTGRIAYRNIDYIEFSAIPGEDTASDVDSLEKIWEQKQKLLSQPRSNAGEIGLSFAEKLLETSNKFTQERALGIFALIEEKDWNTENHPRAKQGRLRSMIALGSINEAMSEARRMAEGAEENPRVLIEANYVLATAEFDQLKSVEEENPRWEVDDEVRPVRNRHFNAALDQFLFPYLFYGSEEEASARGLIAAAEVYQYAKDTANARLCAEDVVKLYPNTKHRKRADELLAKLSP